MSRRIIYFPRERERGGPHRAVKLEIGNWKGQDSRLNSKERKVIGWIIRFVGFAVEATADQQKLTFKSSPQNRGKWCNAGLWNTPDIRTILARYSFWWGVFVASTPVLKGAEWLVIFGPIFLTLLLLFISGIPMLEGSADKKFGNVVEYRLYKRTTSPLIPLPPVVYKNLPLSCGSKPLFSSNFLSTVVIFLEKS